VLIWKTDRLLSVQTFDVHALQSLVLRSLLQMRRRLHLLGACCGTLGAQKLSNIGGVASEMNV